MRTARTWPGRQNHFKKLSRWSGLCRHWREVRIQDQVFPRNTQHNMHSQRSFTLLSLVHLGITELLITSSMSLLGLRSHYSDFFFIEFSICIYFQLEGWGQRSLEASPSLEVYTFAPWLRHHSHFEFTKFVALPGVAQDDHKYRTWLCRGKRTAKYVPVKLQYPALLKNKQSPIATSEGHKIDNFKAKAGT